MANEALDGVTGFLAIVAGSYFCSAAAPAGMLASLNGILTAAIFGIGWQQMFYSCFLLIFILNHDLAIVLYRSRAGLGHWMSLDIFLRHSDRLSCTGRHRRTNIHCLFDGLFFVVPKVGNGQTIPVGPKR